MMSRMRFQTYIEGSRPEQERQPSGGVLYAERQHLLLQQFQKRAEITTRTQPSRRIARRRRRRGKRKRKGEAKQQLQIESQETPPFPPNKKRPSQSGRSIRERSFARKKPFGPPCCPTASCFDSSIRGFSPAGWRLLFFLQQKGLGFPRHTPRGGLSITHGHAGHDAGFAAKTDDIGGPSQALPALRFGGESYQMFHPKCSFPLPPFSNPRDSGVCAGWDSSCSFFRALCLEFLGLSLGEEERRSRFRRRHFSCRVPFGPCFIGYRECWGCWGTSWSRGRASSGCIVRM